MCGLPPCLTSVHAAGFIRHCGGPARVARGQRKRERAEEARQKVLERKRACDLAKVQDVTLRTAVRDYLASRGDKLKPATRKEYERDTEQFFERWLDTPLRNITRALVKARYRELKRRTKKGPDGETITYGATSTSRGFRFLRAVFAFAMDEYESNEAPIIVQNPVRSLTTGKLWETPNPRQSVIQPEQLAAWFKTMVPKPADDDYGNTVRDLCVATLLLGCRRNESSRLRWRDVDLDQRIVTLANTKNRKTLQQPFGPYLAALFVRRLAHAQREMEASNTVPEWVFPNVFRSGPIVAPHDRLELLREEAGVRFLIHDLRRTFATIAEEHLGFDRATTKRLLNHSTKGDVTAGYVIRDMRRARERVEEIETFMLKAGGVFPTAPVLDIGSGRKAATGRSGRRRASVVLHSVWNLSGCWRE